MSVSPELALAAAAAIRDHALREQTFELLELKRQLAESRKVEITGTGGRPVYARGQFEDGAYRDEDDTTTASPTSSTSFYFEKSWWDVQLTKCEEVSNNNDITLHNLQHLEIRLGGIVFATTSKEEVEGHDVLLLDNNSNISNNNSDSSESCCRNVTIPISSGPEGCRNATLQINLIDMPEPPWKMLKSAVSYNQMENNRDEELIDVFDIMASSRQLPQRLPNQIVEVYSVSFDTASVRSMLLCLMER